MINTTTRYWCSVCGESTIRDHGTCIRCGTAWADPTTDGTIAATVAHTAAWGIFFALIVAADLIARGLIL